MADVRITDLTELTVTAGEDLVAVVDNPSGTPVTRKVQLSNLIPDRTRQVFYPVVSYLSDSPSSASYFPWSTVPAFGITLAAGENHGNIGMMGIIPSDYAGDGEIFPVVQTFLGSSGDGEPAYFQYEVNVGEIGDRIDSRTTAMEYEFDGTINISLTMGVYTFQSMTSITLPTVYPNDIVSMEFARRGNEASDTYPNALCVRGAILSYTADS